MTSTQSYGLALLAGAAAALGLAPFDLWPLGLLGLGSLIWLVSVAPRPGWVAWAGGSGYFAVALHWIVEPFLVDAATHGWMAPFALILLASGLALFWALSGWLAGRFFRYRALSFAVLLTGAEILRGHVFTGFPWAMPAYIWADTPLRQAVAWTGSYGLSFVTLVALALPFTVGRFRGLGAAFATLGAVFLVGVAQTEKAGETELLGTVRLVQPNVPQHEKWHLAKVPDHIDRLLALSSDVGEAGLVIWPESAVAYPLDLAGPILGKAFDAAGVPVLLGLNRRENGGEVWHNSLAVVGQGGEVTETYDKVHLVPFGEYIPFRIELLRAMAASSGFGFTPGDAVRLIDTPLGRALPLICYEGIFPGHMFKAGARPDYLLQITNDAWFGTFSGPFQHLDQMRFRAAEQGLPAVRAANTGISAAIDHLGRVTAHLDLGQSGKLDQAVYAGRSTIYAKTGDWPTIVLVLVTLSALFHWKSRNTIARPNRSS